MYIVYWTVNRLNIHIDNALFHPILERSDNDQTHVKNNRVYLFQVPVKIHTTVTETFHFLIFSFVHRSLTVCSLETGIYTTNKQTSNFDM